MGMKRGFIGRIDGEMILKVYVKSFSLMINMI